MHSFFKRVLCELPQKHGLAVSESNVNVFVRGVLEAVDTEEFAALYAERVGRVLPPRERCPSACSIAMDKWSMIMTDLIAAMTAVGAAIAASSAAVDPAHLKAIDDSVAALQEHDAAEDAEIKNVTDALTALSTAAAGGTGTGTGTGTAGAGTGTGTDTGTGGAAA